MKINNIKIKHLRNHELSDIGFANHINIFYGDNGAGKTTILEALSISSFTKSFIPLKEESLIQNDQTSYYIKTEYEMILR